MRSLLPVLLAAVEILAPVYARPVAVLRPSAHESDRSVEQRLRMLLQNRRLQPSEPASAAIPAGFDDLSDLRDAVAAAASPDSLRRRLVGHLPGMAPEPFNLYGCLERSPEAPLSLHVEDEILIPDAIVALVRPWIALQKARGTPLEFEAPAAAPEPLVRAALEGLAPNVLAVDVARVSTGGYDVFLRGGAELAKLYSRERSAILPQSSTKP